MTEENELKNINAEMCLGYFKARCIEFETLVNYRHQYPNSEYRINLMTIYNAVETYYNGVRLEVEQDSVWFYMYQPKINEIRLKMVEITEEIQRTLVR